MWISTRRLAACAFWSPLVDTTGREAPQALMYSLHSPLGRVSEMPLSSSHWRTAFARMRESTALYSSEPKLSVCPSTMKIVSGFFIISPASWSMLRRAEFFITALLYSNRRSAPSLLYPLSFPRLDWAISWARDLLPSGKWESSWPPAPFSLLLYHSSGLTISGSAVLTVAGLAEGFSASGGESSGSPWAMDFMSTRGIWGERDSGGDGETGSAEKLVSPGAITTCSGSMSSKSGSSGGGSSLICSTTGISGISVTSGAGRSSAFRTIFSGSGFEAGSSATVLWT